MCLGPLPLSAVQKDWQLMMNSPDVNVRIVANAVDSALWQAIRERDKARAERDHLLGILENMPPNER